MMLRHAVLGIFAIVALGCGSATDTGSPPGVVVGARLADVRMFEFDRQSRTTLVDGTVLSMRWPWVELGASDTESRARYWVNFTHVCSFRLED